MKNFVNEQNKHLATPVAIDLLERMLQYDHVIDLLFRMKDLLPNSVCNILTSPNIIKFDFINSISI